MNRENEKNSGNLPFEEALNMAGYGFYSYAMTALGGLIVIAFACTVFSATFIVPTSACELGTTSAQQGVIASVPIMGIIVGSIICGYLADKYGRRRVLWYALLSAAGCIWLASISVNWIMLVILQSLASFCAAGEFSLAMTFVSECVPMMKRNMVVLLVTSLFLTAQGIMAIIAIPVIPLSFSIYIPILGIYWNSWRTLLVIYSIPSILAAIGLLFVTESPKYMLVQGREQEAIDIIKTIHRLNHGKSAPSLEISSFIIDTQEIKSQAASRDHIMPLFKMPLLKYTIIVMGLFLCQQLGAFTVWLPLIANQFVRVVQTGEGVDKAVCGLIRDGQNMPPNPNVVPCSLNVVSLLFVTTVSVIQSISNAVLSLFVNRVGRRNITMILTVVCGVSGIVTNMVPNAYVSAILFVIFMIGILTLSLHTAIAVVLFPTHLRAFAVAFTMTSGRLGNIASLQILKLLLDVNCDAGFYIFNSIFAGSAIFLAFLPDDRFLRQPPQTREEESVNMLES